LPAGPHGSAADDIHHSNNETLDCGSRLVYLSADKCVALAVDMRELAGSSVEDGGQLESGAEILLRTPSQVMPETVALVQEFWTRVGFKPRFEVERLP